MFGFLFVRYASFCVDLFYNVLKYIKMVGKEIPIIADAIGVEMLLFKKEDDFFHPQRVAAAASGSAW